MSIIIICFKKVGFLLCKKIQCHQNAVGLNLNKKRRLYLNPKHKLAVRAHSIACAFNKYGSYILYIFRWGDKTTKATNHSYFL